MAATLFVFGAGIVALLVVRPHKGLATEGPARPAGRASVAPSTAAGPSSTTFRFGAPVGLSQIESFSFSSVTVGHAVFSTNSAQAPSAGIAVTTSAGMSWKAQTPLGTFAPYQNVPDLQFVTANDGWVLASSSTGYETGHNLFRTTDGGSTWSPIAVLSNVTEVMPIGADLWAITNGHPDSQNANGATMWTSADNGTSWQRVPTRLPGDAYGPTGPASIWRIGATTAYTTNAGHLERTTDSGITWTALTAPSAPYCPGIAADIDEHFSASSVAALWVICGGEPAAGNEPKTVYRSSDGGEQWSVTASASFLPGSPTVGQISAGGYMFDGSFNAVSNTTAYLALGRLGLLETIDGGRVWAQAVPRYADSTLLSTVNATSSYALLSDGTTPTLWRTSDGTHWAQIP